MFDLKEMAKAMEKLKCPKHKVAATITILRRSLEIKTCCNAFDLVMSQEHERQIAIQAAKKQG